MIKKIKNSLTLKICILMTLLLLASSGITYGAIVGFLPTYYSSMLQEDLAAVSQDMIETIRSYETIEEASHAIQLFEAGAKVDVVILDEQGEWVWPVVVTAVEDSLAGDSAAETAVEDSLAGDSVAETAVEDSLTGDSAAVTTVEENLAGDGVVEELMISDTVEESADMIEAFVEDLDGTAVRMEEKNSAVKRYGFELGGQEYTMLVSGGMQPVNQALGILRQIFPYILGISVLAALLFAVGAALYLTMPVVRLSAISKRMAALDFGSFYQGKRTDEIGALGMDLNELSGNLSRALEDLREVNAGLKSDIEKERELEKKRIAFFSAVSHELKTPITILKGHLSGMLQGVGEYRNRDYYLQRSQDTVEKMEDMVKELLTVSRIENQEFHTQTVDLAELLRQKIADLTELMEKKNLGLEVAIPEHLDAQVNPQMMEKVFSNLLINAIRYTPEGHGNEIRVLLQSGVADEAACGAEGRRTEMSRTGARRTSGRGTVMCRIENTGVHIPEEAVPHLFEAFYRGEQSRNRQTGGSGLGLYIVKMILEQHNAEYYIENSSDGVRFFFSL